jgi:lysosomal Pro-X carboxypeptidase
VTQNFAEQPHSNTLSCDAAWSTALTGITALTTDPAKWPALSSTFSLCTPISSAVNVTQLVNWLTSGLVDMAMTDYPYATNFLQPEAAWPVNASCALFDACLSSHDATMCAAQAIGAYYNGSGTVPCYDLGAGDAPDLGEQGWDYQSCTEMVMPIGQYGIPNDMFVAAPWNTTSFNSYCQATWGVTPDYGWAVREYGGDQIQAGMSAWDPVDACVCARQT